MDPLEQKGKVGLSVKEGREGGKEMVGAGKTSARDERRAF